MKFQKSDWCWAQIKLFEGCVLSIGPNDQVNREWSCDTVLFPNLGIKDFTICAGPLFQFCWIRKI